MRHQHILAAGLLLSCAAYGQQRFGPEDLWHLGRVTGLGLTKDKKYAIYRVGTPDMAANRVVQQGYLLPLAGGAPIAVSNIDSAVVNEKISKDGRYVISSAEVKVQPVTGTDYYPDLPKSNAKIYNGLNYRHWDQWEDGLFGHVFVAPAGSTDSSLRKDIMAGEPYDCPQKPFGGEEDYVWNPDSRHVVYVAKKKAGTAYAISTNTDLYEYDVVTGSTRNLTERNKGYDINPSYSSTGVLAWLQMRREGYESDKQDLVIQSDTGWINATRQRDDLHVEGFRWSDDGKRIYFWAPINGTVQLFEYTLAKPRSSSIRQVTSGDFDIMAILGETGNQLVVTRASMSRAPELYRVDIASGAMQPLTHVNDEAYKGFGSISTERRWVKTSDGKQMLVWVVYPPNFDKNKKYPTLLYCQGGPQSPLTQYFSYRWNFQLMASQGYIIVAPNRRGMPGHGTQWNEQVSKDWGGQALRDYLSAIDALTKEPFVDKARVGCVGASFGGFSVFALEAMHGNRFKTFIAHDGVFDFRSMYGTTDELFFENWEKGGPYWDKANRVAQRSFAQSPSNYVEKWNRPILIVQGGNDFRVPIEQGQQAFQAAQLRGLKSRFLYLPEENHWVLRPQNALVWQREFFKWLQETL
ncbi:S9 family peptidase [Flaviaesturariibacter terrae]